MLLVSRAKKKFLIIFFSIFSALVLYFAAIIIVNVIIEDNKNKTIEKYLSYIPTDNHFLYKYLDQSLIYCGKDYYLEKYIDKDDISVEYVNENYLIYYKYKFGNYSYYVIDSDGNSNLLFDKDEYLRWRFYVEGKFYIENKNNFYTYDINQNVLVSITSDDFLSRNNAEYKAVLYDEKRLKISDVNTGLYKYVFIEDFQENEVIKTWTEVKNKLEIYDYLIVGQDIYIVIRIDYIHAFVISYDFQTETITFVDRIINSYWDDGFKMFYLENKECYPLDALIFK